MDYPWTLDVSSKVFSLIKTKTQNALKNKYPDLYITDEEMQNRAPTFPTVYIHELEGAEIGNDLVNQTINGINFSIQIDVSAKTRTDAKTVMAEVISNLKSMAFTLYGMPILQKTSDVYVLTARGRRILGATDTI